MLIDLTFDPMQFVYNLKYMGIGLLGIFIVIGVIIGATVLLTRTPEKKENTEE